MNHSSASSAPETHAATAGPPAPPGCCWVTIQELEPGMVLARPVVGGKGVNSVIELAAGKMVTSATIEQLINKGIEAVAILRDPPDPETYSRTVQEYAERLTEIFGPEPSSECRPLFDALIACGPCEC